MIHHSLLFSFFPSIWKHKGPQEPQRHLIYWSAYIHAIMTNCWSTDKLKLAPKVFPRKAFKDLQLKSDSFSMQGPVRFLMHGYCLARRAPQCPRTDLNKRSFPRPKTTTAWKLIPHTSKISKNWNPPWCVTLHRFFKNWFLLMQKQLYNNRIQTHFTY